MNNSMIFFLFLNSQAYPEEFIHQYLFIMGVGMSKLQHSQTKPEIFRGEGKDKAKLFRLQSAFNALISSDFSTAEQKLHLTYRYLKGTTKTTIEQLQYMVQTISFFSKVMQLLKGKSNH